FTALEAHFFLKENKVDFIFLDINMPNLSGMELAKLLPSSNKFVFTTAYADYAAESFTFHTIDYLLKPITLQRFLASVSKIEDSFSYRSNETIDNSAVYFFFKSGKTYKKIFLNDIIFFESEQEYVRVVTVTDQLLIYKRLKDVQEQLSLPFVRVHNSYIVNTSRIDKIQDNHIHIHGKRISISEKFKDTFMKLVAVKLF
ncbi:MAG: LytTR family DNA-binding domain-containing protein, partial [Ginsengibacter sp.]